MCNDPFDAMPNEMIAEVMSKMKPRDAESFSMTSQRHRAVYHKIYERAMYISPFLKLGDYTSHHNDLQPGHMTVEEILAYRRDLARKQKDIMNVQNQFSFEDRGKAGRYRNLLLNGHLQQLATFKREAGNWIARKQRGEL